MANSKSLLNFSVMKLSFLILLSLPYNSLALSRDDICNFTLFPSFCTSLLPNNHTADIFDFGRFSARKSLAQSQNFLNSVQNHLVDSANSSEPALIRALKDCHELVSLNVDFLASSIGTLNMTSQLLPILEANDLHTSLSAVLTNLHTCLEGIESTPSAEAIKNDMSLVISDDSKLHSVSLALCTQGWVPKVLGTPASWSWMRHAVWRIGRLPMKMADRVRAKFESALKQLSIVVVEEDGITIRDMVIVSQDGVWDFTTINGAIMAAPNNTAASDGFFLIYVTAGVYEESVSIGCNKKYLFLLGDGINHQTIITGNRSVGDGWTTFNSATVAVSGEGFFAANITVRNTAGPSKGQAVALRNGADKSTFYSCSFEAYQDTLYSHSLRQFYRECDIYGTVDFIFGNAAVVFQNCNIYPRLPLKGQYNTITAQGRTDPNQNTGTSIHNCTIRPAAELAAANAAAVAGYGSFTESFLGRPWKDYSRTVYVQSFMDGFIDPAGWHEWVANTTVYYAEFDDWGPGSGTSKRINWTGYHLINATEAADFTASRFLLGDYWLPQTAVPYTGGLML